MKRKNVYGATAGTLLTLLLVGCGDGDNNNTGRSRVVYAMTNGSPGNAVVAFQRADNGTLSRLGTYPTGGSGIGATEISPATPNDGIDTLASQGSLYLTRDKQFLLAVNTGSNTVSAFRIQDDGSLIETDTKSSGGIQPNAIGEAGGLVYVSNVGNAGNAFASNLSGFRLSSDGTLTPLANSTRLLSTANAQPARVIFNPNGSLLAVSELTTNKISVFPVNGDGTLGTPVVNNSNGAGPFGSAFLSNGRFLVTEAPMPPTPSAVSSYSLAADGTMTPISGSIANGQAATCWAFPTPDETTLFVSNTGSGNVSSYRINGDGTLTLLQNIASPLEGAMSGAVDGGVSEDGRYLYILDSGTGNIVVHGVNNDGTLTVVQNVTGQGIPTRGSEGLVVR